MSSFRKTTAWAILEQEPQMDDEKTVLEVVKEGVAATVAILDEYNQINDQFGLPEVYENADKNAATHGSSSEIARRD